MLIGYVSCEQYKAIAGAHIEFEQDGEIIAVSQSTASGAIQADLSDGEYRVTLACSGFGSKRVNIRLPQQSPYQFRLCSERLTGFMWPKWVRSGETGEFRVNSSAPYHLSLYRYGLKKELVRNIGWFDAHGPLTMLQITPDGDYCGSGVQWNRTGWGSAHHTQVLTAPERSGLYYLHARTDTGEFFSFPWIVAPASPCANIAILASSATWNAYNAFGGRSNYVNARGLPPAPTVNARQDLQRYSGGAYSEWVFADSEYAPLSFERPEPGNHVPERAEVTNSIPGRDACHLAPAEWRTLGWLEREGFEYDLYSDCHLHQGLIDLYRYHALIIHVHPEYWSRKMFTYVYDWVFSRGGRLIYLGGNGLNCEVEFPDESCGVMRCRSRIPGDGASMSARSGPGTSIESRMHRTFQSEAGLLGVVCTDAGIMTAAPYRVLDPSHWAFAGTGLAEGDFFGHETLHERVPGGASGHETDKMSASSPEGTVLLAKGINPERGGAEMVVFETEGGGAVFSVGSITYPAALLIDPTVSLITRNVVDRFCADKGGSV